MNPPIARCSLPGEIGEIGKPMVECPPWDSRWNPKNDLVRGLDVLSVCGHNVAVIWSADAGGENHSH